MTKAAVAKTEAKVPAKVGGALYNIYRPTLFKEVIGQPAAVASLKKVLERDGAHTFLFTGPSGTGKTTLARIAARYVRCEPNDIIEIAAAVFNGVDTARDLVQTMQYQPLGLSESRAIILDECHALSKQAWQALLKATEEPPAHVYWFFCTTEPGRVPATIKTRATVINLKVVNDMALRGLIDDVASREGIKLGDDVRAIIIKNAAGSPRQALNSLEQARDFADDRKGAAAALQQALESEPTLELCRMLLNGRGSWQTAMNIIAKLDEESESVRIIVCNYMAAALLDTASDKQAMHMLSVLDSFSRSYNSSEGRAPLILSIGNVLLAN